MKRKGETRGGEQKRELIKMIEDIQNEQILRFVRDLLISFKEKWGC